RGIRADAGAGDLMAKPQIQYVPIAEPPAFTVPTVDKMGWHPSYPDSVQPFSDRREYRTRGGGHRALADTQSHAVFAVEQWAIPGTKIGAFYGPDDPQHWMERRQAAARQQAKGGGHAGILDTQSHAVFAVEQWPAPLGWGSETP